MPEWLDTHKKLDRLMNSRIRKMDASNIELYECFHSIYELRLRVDIELFVEGKKSEIDERYSPDLEDCTIPEIKKIMNEADVMRCKNVALG